MEMMNYELAQAHIADLKALKNPAKATWQGAGLWESFSGWWQSLKKPALKVSPAYRAELLRQEWVVTGEPLKNPKC
jgi:hypothetical protein